MQGDDADDREFDPLKTHTEMGPLKKADACYSALKHLVKTIDIETEEGRRSAQDTITRAMTLYDIANRPDMGLEVMRFVKLLDLRFGHSLEHPIQREICWPKSSDLPRQNLVFAWFSGAVPLGLCWLAICDRTSGDPFD